MIDYYPFLTKEIMLFRIMRDKDFFDSNPQAELIDEFSKLTSDEMKYIALVYDYDSPYKNLGKRERKEKAERRRRK